jgi:iron complex outermembrane receptor protein
MAVMLTVAAAQMQAGEAREYEELDEVIVTAQFRAQNLQDTPLAITAVSGDQLEDQGVANVTDLGLVIPNATSHPRGADSLDK